MKIAINMKSKNTPWGGGNQFVEQLSNYFERLGHQVTYRLEPDVEIIFMVKSWPTDTTEFGVEEIRAFKQKHPNVYCIQRINECDKRKGSDKIDELLRRANEVADYTVFVSSWLRSYFMERWFDPSKPNKAIYNGADPGIFYPKKDYEHLKNDVFRIVTHHWSDNWMKGFKVYQEVDRMIAEGELEGFSLMVIGRWPSEIHWRSAKTAPPARGQKLAELLRRNDIYITASLWEPSGMHYIEGTQCGLPLVYHEDGGGIVEYGKLYGVGFRDDVKAALIRTKQIYSTLRTKILESLPTGLDMCRQYEEILKLKKQ